MSGRWRVRPHGGFWTIQNPEGVTVFAAVDLKLTHTLAMRWAAEDAHTRRQLMRMNFRRIISHEWPDMFRDLIRADVLENLAAQGYEPGDGQDA